VPKRRRRSRVPVPAWERERGAIGRRVLGRSPQFYATAGVVVLVVAAIGVVAFGFGSNWLEDRNRPGSTAVQVEDIKYSVRYYTERLRQYIQEAGAAGAQIAQNPQIALEPVSNTLIEEAVIRQFAEEQGQTVMEDEVKAQIATMLALSGPDDPSFETKFREELTSTGVTEEEYRDMARAAALRTKLTAEFKRQVPATAEAIHYRQIIVSDQTAADAVQRQITDGADFAQVAGEKSLDTTAKENGGDGGWVPRGILETALEDTLFALEPGQVTTYPTTQNVFVFQVIERQADRPVEETQKDQISTTNLQDWLDEKRASVDAEGRLVNHMELPGGDLDKIQYALSRVQPTT